MHRAPGDSYRMIEPLTGLRALAALWVFSRHFFLAGHYAVGFGTHVELGPAIHIAILGGWGVDLFFVVSGFVMLHVYGEQFAGRLRWPEVLRFYRLRLGRIYPLHVAIMAAMAIGYAIGSLPFDGREPDGKGLLANLLLVHAWGFYDVIVWNRPSWSISLEWFAYLWFPVFGFVFGRIRKSGGILLAIAVLFTVYYLARYEFGGFVVGNLGPGGLLRVTFGFLLGFFLYGLHRRHLLAGISWDAVCVATFAVAIAMMLLNGYGFPTGFALNFPIGLLVLAAANSTGFAARLLDNRGMQYLGEISYSIYLVHFPLLRFLTYNFGDRFAGVAEAGNQWLLWGLSLAVLALLIAVSALCYHGIEVPCRDYVKRRVAAATAYAG